MGADDNRRMNAPYTLDGATALAHLGVIRARGEEASSFLHGQLTSDFSLLPPGQARLAGYCSAKGRLLASFIGWKLSADEILLVCSADLLPATLKRLSMFVLRAKCRLSDATAEFRLLGLAGPSATTWLADAAPGEPWRVSTQGTARFLWAAETGLADPAMPALDPAAWRWGEVASGVPAIEAATADRFVPQMLNFELLGGVDFKKGCYPGQEIVARSQYRGTIKRRTYRFDSAATAVAGQEIFHSADPAQPAGMVANAAATPGGSSLLCEVKLATLQHGTLHLSSAEGPLLSQVALPYEIPADLA